MHQQFTEYKVLRLEWPRKASLGINEACQRLGLDKDLGELKSTWAGMLALQSAPAPIVGVLGLLNAGKSSLVRSFLSETGAKRVLCGEDAHEGTQRFVFWLPQSWRSQEVVWQAFKDELDTVFDGNLEYLSDDPARAREQYNADGSQKGLFPVPLVAFDPSLDTLGFAFLDCPDVERSYPGETGPHTSKLRKKLVKKAAKLMSATLIVADSSKVATEFLADWSDPENGLDQKNYLILLNYVRPSKGVTDLLKNKDVERLLRTFQATFLYAAYDSEMDRAGEMIPAVASQMRVPPGTPLFFEVKPDEKDNARDAVEENRLIHRRLQELQPASMWIKKREIQQRRLNSKIEDLEANVLRVLAQHAKEIRTQREGLIRFVRGQVSKDGNLAFPIPPDVAAQIGEAIYRTAPWWATPALLVAKGTQQAVKTFSGVRKWWTIRGNPSSFAKDEAKALAKRAESSGDAIFFRPKDWASRSMDQKFMPDDVDQAELEKSWKMALDHALHREVKLDDEALKAFGGKLWEGIPIYKRVVLAVSGPFLLLGALAVVIAGAFDGGAGAILFTYSLPQFLAALGLGVLAPVASGAAGIQLEKELVEQAGKPFYIDLLKAALDVFGLPRRLVGDKPEKERFDNTGSFTLSLDAENDAVRLEKMLQLGGASMLGNHIQEGWQALRTAAVAIGEGAPTQDKTQPN
jgi:hypothetical protein